MAGTGGREAILGARFAATQAHPVNAVLPGNLPYTYRWLLFIKAMELTRKTRLFPIHGSPHIASAFSCLLFAALPLVPAGAESLMKRDFANPPLAMKSVPLWHMNGTLTKEEINAQLRDSRDRSGFAGVAVLPVSATRPAYLSEGYFARYGEILEACKELGMKVVFYDDINFPSGSAGGQMVQRFPNDIASRLDKTESDVVGPISWKQAMPEGIFMGAVAMNPQTWERKDISTGV